MLEDLLALLDGAVALGPGDAERGELLREVGGWRRPHELGGRAVQREAGLVRARVGVRVRARARVRVGVGVRVRVRVKIRARVGVRVRARVRVMVRVRVRVSRREGAARGG